MNEPLGIDRQDAAGASQDETAKSNQGARRAYHPKSQPLEYAFQLVLAPLLSSLQRIETKLNERPATHEASPPSTPAEESALSPIEPIVTAEIVPAIDRAEWEALVRRVEEWSQSWQSFREATLAEFTQAREALVREAIAARPATPAPPAPLSPPPPAAASNGDHQKSDERGTRDDGLWEEILLGRDLCAQSVLADARRQLLLGVTNGEIAARALAGQLLLVQGATADELPERLRHVGEAYYRWRPRATLADDPFETRLAEWLTRCAENAGFRLSIELVRPGDRFDSTRHVSAGRGVEVVSVHGWLVIRDGHKVYTKANVSVR